MNAERKGSWIQLYSGRQFWPLDPRPEEICLESMAHALSNLCRWGGHSKDFYSVAEHSVRVSYACDRGDELAGLLHDAAEGFGLVDMPRPVKKYLVDYGPIETLLLYVVFKWANLPVDDDTRQAIIPPSVHHADDQLLATERRDLLLHPPPAPTVDGHRPPLGGRIMPMYPHEAKARFLDRAKGLGLRP